MGSVFRTMERITIEPREHVILFTTSCAALAGILIGYMLHAFW